jgi:hypothetical protein
MRNDSLYNSGLHYLSMFTDPQVEAIAYAIRSSPNIHQALEVLDERENPLPPVMGVLAYGGKQQCHQVGLMVRAVSALMLRSLKEGLTEDIIGSVVLMLTGDGDIAAKVVATIAADVSLDPEWRFTEAVESEGAAPTGYEFLLLGNALKALALRMEGMIQTDDLESLSVLGTLANDEAAATQGGPISHDRVLNLMGRYGGPAVMTMLARDASPYIESDGYWADEPLQGTGGRRKKKKRGGLFRRIMKRIGSGIKKVGRWIKKSKVGRFVVGKLAPAVLGALPLPGARVAAMGLKAINNIAGIGGPVPALPPSPGAEAVVPYLTMPPNYSRNLFPGG